MPRPLIQVVEEQPIGRCEDVSNEGLEKLEREGLKSEAREFLQPVHHSLHPRIVRVSLIRDRKVPVVVRPEETDALNSEDGCSFMV